MMMLRETPPILRPVLVPSIGNFQITREMVDRLDSFFQRNATNFPHDYPLKYDEIRGIHDARGIRTFIAEKNKTLKDEYKKQKNFNYLQMNAKLNQQKVYYYAAFGYLMMGEVPDEVALCLWSYFRDESSEDLLEDLPDDDIKKILIDIKKNITSYSSDNSENVNLFKKFVGHYFYKENDVVSEEEKSRIIALIKFILYQYGLLQFVEKKSNNETKLVLMLTVPALLEGSNKLYTIGGSKDDKTLGCETNVRRNLSYAVGKVKDRKNAKPRATRKRKLIEIDDCNTDSEADSINSQSISPSELNYQFFSEDFDYDSFGDLFTDLPTEFDFDEQELIDILISL